MAGGLVSVLATDARRRRDAADRKASEMPPEVLAAQGKFWKNPGCTQGLR